LLAKFAGEQACHHFSYRSHLSLSILVFSTEKSNLARIENGPAFRRKKWKIHRFLDFLYELLELQSFRSLKFRCLFQRSFVSGVDLKLALALFELGPEVENSFFQEKRREELCFAFRVVFVMENLKLFH